MTLINNPAYVDLVQGGEIDIAISPQLATIGTLLAHVRRGDIERTLTCRGAAEAIEVVAHGDAKSSKVIGRSINDIKLPPGTTIGALVRDEEVLTPTATPTSRAATTCCCSWSTRNTSATSSDCSRPA